MGHIRGHRFFDQDVFACFERRLGQGIMAVYRVAMATSSTLGPADILIVRGGRNVMECLLKKLHAFSLSRTSI